MSKLKSRVALSLCNGDYGAIVWQAVHMPRRHLPADQTAAPEGTVPPPTMDTNEDGKADAWDRDGNGVPDAWDINGDGKPDLFDNDGDGKPDDKAPKPAKDK